MNNAQFTMLASIFFFSLAGYFSSLLAIQLLAISMLIRFLLPTAFSFIKMKGFSLSQIQNVSTLALSCIRGLVIFFSQYLLYLSINKLGLAPGLILYNLGPIFLIMIFTFTGNSLRAQDMFVILFSFLGVLTFFDFEFKLENEGILLAVIAAFLHAVSQFINAGMAKRNEDPKTLIMLVNFSATIAAVVYLFFFVGIPEDIQQISLASLALITGMGLATYFNQYFRIVAFKLSDNPNSLVYLIYFCVPFSLAFSFFTGETISQNQLYGAAIILLGGFCQVYTNRKKSSDEEIETTTVPSVGNKLAEEKA